MLALTRIVVREQMCCTRVPVIPKPFTQFQTYMRIMLNVADLPRPHPMLCHQPKLICDTSSAHWRAAWLSGLPSFRFQQRISGQRQSNRKRDLDWRVEYVFLKRVNNPMFHYLCPPFESRVILTAVVHCSSR